MAATAHTSGVDSKLVASRAFAEVFREYIECSDKIQKVIRDMVEIVTDPDATEEERRMACITMADALFPSYHDGRLGVELQNAEDRDALRSQEFKESCDTLDAEETCFADCVQTILKDRGMSQAALADACGIGESAISNLLSRRSRPQRRTVEKIANALNVLPAAIWPVDANRT